MKTTACVLLLLLHLEARPQNSPSLPPVQSNGVSAPSVISVESVANEEIERQAILQAASIAYLTNVACVFDIAQGWTVSFAIQGGNEDVPHGMFRTLDFAETVPIWDLLGAGYSGDTYAFGHQPANQAFYALGDLVAGPQVDSLLEGVAYWNAAGPLSIGGPVVQVGNLSSLRAFAASGFAVTRSAAVSLTATKAIWFANLPATWLARFFGANWQTNPAAAADADPDGDGVSNFQEHRRGRNPLAGAVADRGDQTRLRVFTPLK